MITTGEIPILYKWWRLTDSPCKIKAPMLHHYNIRGILVKANQKAIQMIEGHFTQATPKEVTDPHIAMACFHLLRDGYDTEVICVYITELVFYCLLVIIVLCDLYFDSHILLCWCITLIFILYVISIKCVYVREYYEYSLTVNKSLLLLLLWEHLISVHSHQHPTSLLLDRHFQLWLLLISEAVIHWIMAHMTLQAYILLVVCLLYKELQHTALGYSLG